MILLEKKGKKMKEELQKITLLAGVAFVLFSCGPKKSEETTQPTKEMATPQPDHHVSPQGPHYSDLIIAVIFTLPLVAHMLGLPVPAFIQLICASIVQFWSGRRFYKAAWKALKHFRADMDLLVTLGTSAAYGY